MQTGETNVTAEQHESTADESAIMDGERHSHLGESVERDGNPLSGLPVSEDVCLVRTLRSLKGATPVIKILAGAVETTGAKGNRPAKARIPWSPQPSPEYLASLGIKVRDFAYESTLPPIVPVLRVPRQVQPEPLPRKRYEREWDDENSNDEASSQGSRPSTLRKLERRPTEPLDAESLPMLERKMLTTPLKQANRVYAPATTPSPPASPLSSSCPKEAPQLIKASGSLRLGSASAGEIGAYLRLAASTAPRGSTNVSATPEEVPASRYRLRRRRSLKPCRRLQPYPKERAGLL